MKKLLFLILLASNQLLGQTSASNDYYATKTDTVYCSKLDFTCSYQGYLKLLTFTNTKGDSLAISGKENLVNVITIKIGNVIYDKVPQKVHRPNGYVKFIRRAIDGKLIVYDYRSVMRTQQMTSEIVKFFIKMPDGVYYNINKKKHLKKYIIPYISTCYEFLKVYNREMTNEKDKFMEMIKLYNSVCE